MLRHPFFVLLLSSWLFGLVACQPEASTEGESEAAAASEATTPEITIRKLEGSPAFPEAGLSLADAQAQDSGMYQFAFDVEGYELGVQTQGPSGLANSGKGQHIHFIVDNGPYAAHYESEFATDQLSEPGNHVVLAFLSRSYHESVKNMEAPTSFYIGQFQTGEGEYEEADFTAPHMFYSRPKGTYTGADTEQLLLDFFLLNTTLSPDGNQVRATINDTEFMLDEWAPYVLENLPTGELRVKLELIDNEGNPVPGPFNVVERTVMLEEGSM